MSAALDDTQTTFLSRFLNVRPAEAGPERPDLTALFEESVNPADYLIAAKMQVADNLARLQSKLAESENPDAHRIAKFGLDGITEGNSVALMGAMLAERMAPAATKPAAADKVRQACKDYRAFLTKDPIIALCEDNPFVKGVSIVAPLTAALRRIEDAVTPKSAG